MDNLTLDMAAAEAAAAAWVDGVPFDTVQTWLWDLSFTDAALAREALADEALEREALADASRPVYPDQPCAFYAPTS